MNLSELILAESAPGKFQWAVPESLPLFEGHFPNEPILPAVAIVDVSIEAIRRIEKALRFEVTNLDRTKITAPITPGKAVTIEVEKRESNWNVVWKDETHALASLVLQGKVFR